MLSYMHSVALYVTSAHADAKGNGSSKILEAVPLLLATIYYLFAPFFSDLTRNGLIEYLDKEGAEWKGPEGEVIPPHLTPKAIAANIDWVIDAPQLVPTLLLPLTAAVFAFKSNNVPAVILALSSIVITVAALWIYNLSPLKYRSYKMVKKRYTVVAATGVLLNGAAAILILVM